MIARLAKPVRSVAAPCIGSIDYGTHFNQGLRRINMDLPHSQLERGHPPFGREVNRCMEFVDKHLANVRLSVSGCPCSEARTYHVWHMRRSHRYISEETCRLIRFHTQRRSVATKSYSYLCIPRILPQGGASLARRYLREGPSLGDPSGDVKVIEHSS